MAPARIAHRSKTRARETTLVKLRAAVTIPGAEQSYSASQLYLSTHTCLSHPTQWRRNIFGRISSQLNIFTTLHQLFGREIAHQAWTRIRESCRSPHRHLRLRITTSASSPPSTPHNISHIHHVPTGTIHIRTSCCTMRRPAARHRCPGSLRLGRLVLQPAHRLPLWREGKIVKRAASHGERTAIQER
jgi:hypothetical protein